MTHFVAECAAGFRGRSGCHPRGPPVPPLRTRASASGLKSGHSRASSAGQLASKPSQNCPAAAGWPDAPPGASGPEPRPQARCGWHCSLGSGRNTTGILKIKGLETVAWLRLPELGRGQTGTMGGGDAEPWGPGHQGCQAMVAQCPSLQWYCSFVGVHGGAGFGLLTKLY